MIAADVSSVARLLRGEAGKKGAPEIVTMDLLGGCGAAAAEDEVVDLEVTVPAGWERRLDLLSGKTFLTPRHQSVQGNSQDLNLPPPASASAPATTSSAAVCTLDMVRSALERAAAGRLAASSTTTSTSSASTSSSSSSAGKRNRSPPTTTDAPPAATPVMRAAACSSCLTYVLIAEADPRCPRCSAKVPPLGVKPSAADDDNVGGSSKKPKIDLNAAADETE
ncbi:hypothetical protein PR202_ga19038 [Eleusine coracana subsp. coracana]|uniref:GIR1-like zinc ribbon domain-containing protein n=1 Tax=Eleusine coracana subsp. coracana TaxID=191504 RepID=A0AAV5CUV9_ELECO|nr:hypothetical protein PR202_ga19038 [Eleusine coracana subsp. coracana]